MTVSNNGGIPAQYTDLQVAHNSANFGDTLFVHASGVSYGNGNVSKQIAIIGEGNGVFSSNAAQAGLYPLTYAYVDKNGECLGTGYL